jgi:ABC-type branched-subunit amino acid transport system ATPase component
MNTILEGKNLSKNFDGIKALDDLSFSIEENKIISLIGPNGSGKTTLFNIITGFLEPDNGEVYYKGKPILEEPPHHIANLGIGRTFQNLRLLQKITVLDNVLLAFKDQSGESFFGVYFSLKNKKEQEINREKALTLIEFVGLSEKAEDLAENLSYGQQKLLTLACCIAMDADLLLLDEPVAGLSSVMIAKMFGLMKELKKQGKTIFFIEHNLKVVTEVSDKVIVIDEGKKIAEGEPRIVIENPKVIEAYLE